MDKARLNGLALMYIHRDVVDSAFGRRNPRQMKLYAIPSSQTKSRTD